MLDPSHEGYMHYCITLGEIALQKGNPPVGAILVVHDTIIGEGYETAKTSGDVTEHAEILAIRDAVQKGNSALLENAILYTTHEPCLMCSYAIRHYKIPTIVYSLAVPDVGGHSSTFNVLITDKIEKWNPEPAVIAGICKDQCALLQQQFTKSN